MDIRPRFWLRFHGRLNHLRSSTVKVSCQSISTHKHPGLHFGDPEEPSCGRLHQDSPVWNSAVLFIHGKRKKKKKNKDQRSPPFLFSYCPYLQPFSRSIYYKTNGRDKIETKPSKAAFLTAAHNIQKQIIICHNWLNWKSTLCGRKSTTDFNRIWQ